MTTSRTLLGGLGTRTPNAYLAVIEYSYPIQNTRVNVWSEKHIGRDDGLYSSNETGVKGMLEGTYFCIVDKVMPFLCCVLDICLQRGQDDPLKTIQSAYNELLSTALNKPNGIATRSKRANDCSIK